LAGGLELSLFHPVDTVAKRLMANTGSFSRADAAKILFQDQAQAGWGARFRSLFPGLGFAAIYKISQRVYKFGGQTYVKNAAKKCFEPKSKVGTTLCDSFAGMFIGIGEVALLPFDVLKIKYQTNELYRSLGFFEVFRKEGIRNLYSGWGWTMARNAPGSFCLFGGNALVMNTYFV